MIESGSQVLLASSVDLRPAIHKRDDLIIAPKPIRIRVSRVNDSMEEGAGEVPPETQVSGERQDAPPIDNEELRANVTGSDQSPSSGIGSRKTHVREDDRFAPGVVNRYDRHRGYTE